MAYFFTAGPALARGYRVLGALGFEGSLVYAHRQRGPRPRLSELPQSDFDGFSGLAYELKAAGALTPGSYPPPAPPRKRAAFFPWRWLRRAWQAVKVLRGFSKPSQTWRELPRKVAAPVEVWKFFTVEETDTLRAAAKAAGISMQSHLLFHLNDVVKPRLTHGTPPAIWAVVVSFHPAEIPVGIQSVAVELPLLPVDTAASVHAKIQRVKKEERYWGAILVALAASLLPSALYRKIVANTYAVKQRVGTFLNLGVWTGMEQTADEAWAVVPPVNAGRPLGAGAVEFNGKLGLGLKLDPSVGLDETDGGFLLERWGEAALAWRWS